MKLSHSIGKRIRTLLKEKKISIYKLTKLTGLSYNALFSIMNENNKDIKLSTLIIIANALSISVSELLNDDNTPFCMRKRWHLFGMPNIFLKEYLKNQCHKSKKSLALIFKINKISNKTLTERLILPAKTLQIYCSLFPILPLTSLCDNPEE